MAHVRTQIRGAIRDLLVGLPQIAGRVHLSRVYAVDLLPALSIYSDADEVLSDEGVLGADKLDQLRSMSLRIEIRDRASSDLDDNLDSIAALIESAMATDVTLGGLAEWLTLEATSFEFDGDSEAPSGVATLTYAITYRVSATDPETVID